MIGVRALIETQTQTNAMRSFYYFSETRAPRRGTESPFSFSPTTLFAKRRNEDGWGLASPSLSSSRLPYHAQYRQRYTTPRRFDDGSSPSLPSDYCTKIGEKALMVSLLHSCGNRDSGENPPFFFTLGFDSLILSQVTYSSSAGSSD